jgi:ABC-type glucose/galactose transport system permease subunit
MSDVKESTWYKIGGWARDNTNLLLLIALIIAGALSSDNFFSWTNLMNLMRRVSVNGVMAIGFTMTLLVGGSTFRSARRFPCARCCASGSKRRPARPRWAWPPRWAPALQWARSTAY